MEIDCNDNDSHDIRHEMMMICYSYVRRWIIQRLEYAVTSRMRQEASSSAGLSFQEDDGLFQEKAKALHDS
jgi:hypothetical protein